ncbi:autophagy-related protein 2 homolog B-like [Uloborus diversus]|uniref:autophagy-related protein 2 homolog B-like n=1 Tax=Uloborus diversus TaxID=327109 RepID=UPI00240A42BE|nr:autophagy-related protein 2 homolog B-like [Uloborus diversus]
MKWNFFSLETMFKRIFRYLLKRYFGPYLEDFSQDELTYGLSHGKGSVENVRLNVEALNELSEEYNLPVNFLHGSIDFVSITVPWTALLCENTVIEIRGLNVVVQPKERPEDVSMFDSVWGSMASSLQLAEECLNSKTDDDEELDLSDKSEGLEKIARTIDAVLANMKVRFFNTSFKIEQLLENGYSGIGLEIRISMAEYFDEAGVNVPSSEFNLPGAEKCTYEPQAYSNKKVVFEGVNLYTSEFVAHDKTYFKTKPIPPPSLDPSQFIPGSPEMPPTHSTLPVKKNEPEVQNEPILISRLNGQQELKLKLKQNETLIGPKVDVEFNLGALNLFLIPQQVHMLFELIFGLMKPSSDSDSAKHLPHSVLNKPMRPADYALVEQELLRQQTRSEIPTKSLKNQRGWSSQSFDESDEEFHLMPMENRRLQEFPTSTNDNESMCSSISSDSRSESGPQKGHKSRSSSVQAMLQDPLSELTHFRVCCSSCCIIILHDDSVNESINYNPNITLKTNSLSLKDRAEIFFKNLLDLQLSGFNFKDFMDARGPLSKLCQANHLRIMSSAITIDGNEKSSSAQRILNFCISLFQLEILECLFDSSASAKDVEPTYMQILKFQNAVGEANSNEDRKEASCKIRYQQIECTTQNRNVKPPANKLDVQLGLMACEVDISLTDRIRTLLNFHNFFPQTDTKDSSWKNSDVEPVSRISSKTEINVSSPNLEIKLRFPVPDLRSVHDMERVPWWQQNLHKEILIMELQDVTFNTMMEIDTLCTKYEAQCRDFHGLFQISPDTKPISFLRVSVDPDADEMSRDRGFDWPRLVIRKITTSAFGDLESDLQATEEAFFYSLSDALLSNMENEPSPFCSSPVLYNSKLKNKNNIDDDKKNSLSNEEVIKPANKETILNFIEQTVSKSKYTFDFTLPSVNAVLPDKDFFELLYNRLGSDLLLWENASLAPTNTYDPSGFKVHVPGLDFNPCEIKDSLDSSCFKPFSNDSNSDSGDEESAYYSVSEYCQRQKEKQKRRTDNHRFTKLSLSLAITKGMLTINTPALDENGEAISDFCGKLQLRVEEGLIFIASSYKGDSNESYLCLLSEKSCLYHDGLIPCDSNVPCVQPYSSSLSSNLNCIIYESDKGMLLKPVCDNKKNDMLKVSIHIVSNPKQLIKTFKVAIDISDATLRHYTYPVPQIWINQFIDFLKVKDYPVNGYIPAAVVTELHLNLSYCAVDYRPLKLPLSTALTVEHFNMSCNVTATTPTFLFRIISEELRLFISNKASVKKVDLRKNYVCVIDTGLIDLSFRSCMDDKNNPKLETYVTNNKIDIRTCADSFRALLDLVVYLSANGDMDTHSSTPQVEKKEPTEQFQTVIKTDEKDSENVNLLMAEAMKEYSNIHLEGKDNSNYILENQDDFDAFNVDDEFCILEDDPGIGFMPKNGEPQIRMLTDQPIKIIENHFAIPPGKSDDLKAPEHYPDPVILVALREMCLIWHIYGGSDFKQKEKLKKKITFSKTDTVYRSDNEEGYQDAKDVSIDGTNSAVSFCKVTRVAKNSDENALLFSMEHVTLEDNKKTNTTEVWLHKGGPCRSHDVLMELQLNKVQFQREIYPAEGTYASRYILLIQDAEIRDKLAVSQINKFLYQFSSQSMPRQSHANMIDVKALYTRPDPKQSSEECSLRVSCKPLRLNIDQDSLMFLIDFFQEVLGMQIDEPNTGAEEGLTIFETNQQRFFEDPIDNKNLNEPPTTSDTFYRFFSFSPDVLIRIDYHGKRVLMEQGALYGILMGLANLTSSEIKLKRLCYRHGLLGHQKLLNYALSEWQQDILKNQKGPVLSGMGGVHSVVQFLKGVKDLFYLPVVQYQKDGQIVRGLQQGASSFSTCTFMAFLDLTSRVVSAIQGVATVACDVLSPGPSVTYKYQRSQENYRRNCQPADIREGVATAYTVVKEGLSDTARTIYRVASAEHEHKGVSGAVGGVLRQIPPTIFKPIILGSEATNYVLGGVRHQLLPDAHQEDIHKWRTQNN